MEYLETVKRIFFSPRQFFNELPQTGGYGEPLKFVVTNLGLSLLLNFAASMVQGKAIFGLTSSITAFLTVIIFTIISMFVGSGILHGLLKLFGAKKGFESTFRIVAYMTAFGLLSWIPYVAYAVLLYVFYLEIVTFARIHEISTLRSFLAVAIIPIIYLIIVFSSAFSYLWMSSLQKDVMTTTQDEIWQQQLANMPEYSMVLSSVKNRDNHLSIVLKNKGKAVLGEDGFEVYVNDIPADYSGCNAPINMFEDCTMELAETPFPSKNTSAEILVKEKNIQVKYLCSVVDGFIKCEFVVPPVP